MLKSEVKILVIDDDIAVCQSLKLLFGKKGFEVATINHPQLVLDKILEFTPDLIVLDMNFSIDTSGRQGLKLLTLILQKFPDQNIILMTGWATVQLAVEGMKIGAKDFLAKPWDNQQLLSSVHTILSLEFNRSKNRLPKSLETSHIIGNSEPFLEVMDMVQRVANTDANVLILGESGTGKEVIAESIHQMSKRRDNPFVKVNLGGIPSSLFESEMFGHKKGAFTDAHSDRIGRFELAHRGTIFLDEIGDLPLENQVKLLRVLQEKKFEAIGSSNTIPSDFRVISATNKDLNQLVNDSTFREDLFYRINLITIHLPALRERKDDIPLLVDHFIKNTCELYEINTPKIHQSGLSWLMEQSFPGNIRQLKNLVERCVLLHMNKGELTIDDFEKITSQKNSSIKDTKLPKVGAMSLEDMEKQMILKTLNHHQFSISETSKSLGITRSSLYRRMDKYNISKPNSSDNMT